MISHGMQSKPASMALGEQFSFNGGQKLNTDSEVIHWQTIFSQLRRMNTLVLQGKQSGMPQATDWNQSWPLGSELHGSYMEEGEK